MNKVILIGRLTKDPDCNEKVARYTLAVDRPIKSEGGQDADFISCVVFGKSIDFVENYLHKGMKIAVEGRIQTGSYTKDDGTKVFTTDVIVDRHEFCESRRNSESDADTEPVHAHVPSGTANLNDLSQFGVVHFDDVAEQEELPF